MVLSQEDRITPVKSPSGKGRGRPRKNPTPSRAVRARTCPLCFFSESRNAIATSRGSTLARGLSRFVLYRLCCMLAKRIQPADEVSCPPSCLGSDPRCRGDGCHQIAKFRVATTVLVDSVADSGPSNDKRRPLRMKGASFQPEKDASIAQVSVNRRT